VTPGVDDVVTTAVVVLLVVLVPVVAVVVVPVVSARQWSSLTPPSCGPCSSHSAPWLGCGSGLHSLADLPWLHGPCPGGSAASPALAMPRIP